MKKLFVLLLRVMLILVLLFTTTGCARSLAKLFSKGAAEGAEIAVEAFSKTAVREAAEAAAKTAAISVAGLAVREAAQEAALQAAELAAREAALSGGREVVEATARQILIEIATTPAEEAAVKAALAALAKELPANLDYASREAIEAEVSVLARDIARGAVEEAAAEMEADLSRRVAKQLAARQLAQAGLHTVDELPDGSIKEQLNIALKAIQELTLDQYGLETILERNSNIADIIRLSDGPYLVKMEDSGEWWKISPNDDTVATLVDNIDQLIRAEVGSDAYLVLDLPHNQGCTAMHFERGPPADTKTIHIEDEFGWPISVQVDPQTSRYYIPWEKLAATGNADEFALFLRQRYQGFIEHLNAEDYRNLAKDIVDIGEATRPLLELDLNLKLTEIDELLGVGNFEKAITEIDPLIRLYGEQPELTLRKALAQLSLGEKQQIIADTLNVTDSRPLIYRDAFFDEINDRLSNQALSEADMATVTSIAQFADWTDYLAKNGLTEGTPKVVPENDRLVLAYLFNESLHGEETSIADMLATKNVVVYVQDTPGLSNLDWNVSLEVAMNQLPEGELPTIIRLPRGDIAHFNPTVIYTPEGKEFRRVASQNNLHPAASQSIKQIGRTYRPYQKQDGEDNKEGESVFVITM